MNLQVMIWDLKKIEISEVYKILNILEVTKILNT